jgi:hypothetical protein
MKHIKIHVIITVLIINNINMYIISLNNTTTYFCNKSLSLCKSHVMYPGNCLYMKLLTDVY